jgi:hypothetical protein
MNAAVGQVGHVFGGAEHEPVGELAGEVVIRGGIAGVLAQFGIEPGLVVSRRVVVDARAGAEARAVAGGHGETSIRDFA